VERVIVVGGPGAGKSTLARRAASALSAVHVELDAIWWQQGWTHMQPDEFRDAIRDVLDSAPKWVVDGNYIDEIAPSLWPLADTLVWIDIGRRTAFRRAVLRSARRVLMRQELWNGNRETIKVLSARSLRRLWSRWPSYRDRIRGQLDSAALPHLTVVRLTSRHELRRWLASIAGS
jgi:adenylate kinase family enzyme